MPSGIPLAIYKTELAWGKSAGIADVAPLWTAASWTGGANAAYNTYVNISNLTGLTVRDTGSDFTQAVTITRGKNARLGAVQEGTLSVPIRDPAKIFSVLNGASPLNGKLTPAIGIRFSMSVDNGTTWHPRFMGFTKTFSRTPGRWGHGTITASDLIRRLSRHANAGILLGSISHTGDALAAIMAKLPWAYTSFANGIAVDSSTGLQNNFSFADTLLSVIQGIVDPSLGTFFIAADGTAVFLARTTNLGGATAITNVMTAVPAECDEDLIYNEAIATMTRPGVSGFTPLQQKVSDATSINQYGKATWSMSSPWWASNADALAAANFILSKYKTPINRVRTMTLEGRDTASLAAIATVDIGNTVVVTEGQDSTSGTYVVWGLTETITKDRHSVTYTHGPVGF